MHQPISRRHFLRTAATAALGAAATACQRRTGAGRKWDTGKDGRLNVSDKTKSLYGFSPKFAPFVGQTPDEQVALLQSWGNTVVFGGYQSAQFVDAAHQAGLKVFAEFGCFVGPKWWSKVSASRPITAEGEPLQADERYYGVNPTEPGVRRDQLAALESLLNRYQIDGVWLDFIRWPCHWEVRDPYLPRTSFDPATLAHFSQETGIDLPQGDVPTVAKRVLERHEAEWTNWRCAQITSWVAEAKAVLQRVRPGAILGLFGVPWRLADRDRAILNVIGQDYHALGEHVDIFSPMVYHLMCGYPPDWIGDVTKEVHALSGKPVWPIIQSIDEPEALSAEEYGQALDVALRSSASEGVLVFNMEGALPEAKIEITRQKFGM